MIFYNEGNATGLWSASLDSEWATLSNVKGEIPINSNTNVRLVYSVSDTTLQRGTSHTTKLTVLNAGSVAASSVLCTQSFQVYRRFLKPTMEAVSAMQTIGSTTEVLEMFPKLFDPTINSYTINVAQEVQKIYLKLDMKTTQDCGAFCLYDTIDITRWKSIDGATAFVRYNKQTHYTAVIPLLGEDRGGELTKVIVTLAYDVHNKDSGRVDSRLGKKTKNIIEFNIVRAGPPVAKPTEAPSVLSLKNEVGSAGIEVRFVPVLYKDQNRGDVIDTTITSYVFTFSNDEEFEYSLSDFNCDQATTSDTYNECTHTFKITQSHSYSVSIQAKNSLGLGPSSTESTTPAQGGFQKLPWVPNCVKNMCSVTKPEITAKPLIQVNNDLSATVSLPLTALKLGSSTPLTGVTCTTTPGSLVGTSSLFKSDTFTGYKIQILKLNPSESYTVVCVLSDYSGTSSLNSPASDSFEAVNIPTTAPKLISVLVQAVGVTVDFIPLLLADGATRDLSVTAYVFSFHTVSKTEDFALEMKDLTCADDALLGVVCSTSTPIVLTNDGDAINVVVKAKNVKGTGPSSIQSQRPAVEPWFHIKWKTPCEASCHSLPPTLSKPYPSVNSNLQTEVQFASVGSFIGSATPLGAVTCTTSPGGFIGTGSSTDGVLIEDKLDPTQIYTVSCTVIDSNKVVSAAAVSDSYAAVKVPTIKPSLYSIRSIATGVQVRFVPLLSGTLLDPTVTSYVIVFTNSESFEVNTAGCNDGGGSMMCTVLLGMLETSNTSILYVILEKLTG